MTKIIYGSVNADGSIASGIGFTVQRSGVGTYEITFENSFTKMPTVVGTQCYSDGNYSWDNIDSGGGETLDNLVVIAVTTNLCKLKTGNSENRGDACDRKFGFIAIGE